MSSVRVKLAIGVAVLGVVATTTAAVAGQQGKSKLRAALSGYEEVPALSTPGVGSFRASVNRAGTAVNWQLRYEGLQAVTQSHIHFEQKSNNGAITVFLCSNLPNPPAGTQACPPSGVVTGTFTAAEVGAGAEAQGIAAGELGEVIAAMRAGATYVNVHTTGRPGGEIRGQIGVKGRRGRH
jgi:hypothetical protein